MRLFRHLSWQSMLSIGIAAVLAILYIAETYSWTETMLPSTYEAYAWVYRTTDMAAYLDHARQIISLRLPDEPFYRAPLYSFFLAGVLLFSDKILAIAIVQGILMVVTVLLTYHIGKLLFGRNTGMIAALLLTFYGGYFYWVIIPHSAILEAFLASLAIYAIFRMKHRFTITKSITAGACCSLLCLIRPNFVIITPAILGLVCLEKYFENHCLKAILPAFFSCAVAGFLVLLPCLAWNNMHSDKLVLLSTNGFATWRLGNSYDSVTDNFLYPEKPLIPVASTYFWKHQLKKGLAFCKTAEYPQNVSYYTFSGFSRIIPFLIVHFGLIFSLFMAAFIYDIPSMRRYWPIYAFVLAYSLTIILFFPIGRFRITVVPLIVVMAAGFLRNIYLQYKNQPLKDAPIRQQTFLALSILAFLAFYLMSEPWKNADIPQYWNNTARICLDNGDIGRYQTCLDRFLSFDIPQNKRYDALLDYGAANSYLWKWNDAEKSFSELRKKYPDDPYVARTTEEYACFKICTHKNELSEFNALLEKNTGWGHMVFFYHRYFSQMQESKKHGVKVKDME